MLFHRAADAPKTLRRRRTLGLLFSTACLGTLLSGCGSSSSSTSSTKIRSLNAYVPANGGDASLSIITTGGVTVSGSTTSGAILGFGMVSGGGGYTLLNSGLLTLNAAGTNVANTITLTSNFNGNNTEYTVVAAGESGQTGTLAPQLISIPSFTANQILIPSGDAAVRVVNVSLLPTIGLFNLTGVAPTVALASGLGSVPYGYSAVANSYVAVPTAQLGSLALVNTTAPSVPLSLSTSSNLNSFTTFTSGQAYTLYVYGLPGSSGQPLGATWVQDYP